MAITVQMPTLGESVTEGTVTRWLKQQGDTVALDEPLLEVSTDKVDTEIPSPAAGVLTEILAREDETVAVGSDLALIAEADSAPTEVMVDNRPPPTRVGAPPEAVRGPAPDRQSGSELDAAEQAPSGDAETLSVTMPELGESITEGTVTRWLKDVGDYVEVNEALVEVSTDKVDTEIPSPAAGTLLAITAAADQVVPVGAELGKLGAARTLSSAPPRASEAPPQSQREAQTAGEPAPQFVADVEPRDDPAPGAEPAARVAPKPAAPPAPAPVDGRSTAGHTHPADRSHQTSPSRADAPVRGTVQKASRIRQLTAAKTHESLLSTAQLTQTHEVDMTAIAALRARAKKSFAEREGVNLTFLPFIATAAIDALKAHPNINASYDEESKTITYHDAEHLGFAVDTARGLLAPVVSNAGDLSLGGLARAIVDVAARARSGDLTPNELSGGTFTITNIGSEGGLFDTPILVQPQAAILATGVIRKEPRVVLDAIGNESIGVRSVCYLSMTYDHRLVDGADAGRFLSTIKRRLEAADFAAELDLERGRG
ncbi:2-oxoglutarate dehydrogenase, E2 component, dihydrolipoamide succinyltransferase [Mycobacterium sp. MOTT36Y]|uniref:2-oxoglutarate dehydrogenase, E2 component, dihydrolipoamide succinyltransferase n=1 Tax=Mycobacterium sp. MOTT36Y TaxID=1168287 RepID=UPI00025D58DB|nr:2-oxoglutarate dehydrogenase, E2 component, dihydrolipoamide succinyltransferase [Mycobacterium sp. MOTT36Y]AFJ34609.1 dihydrolipoamide acetyltransferase [Mycobacterium sp. MOTT36Y]